MNISPELASEDQQANDISATLEQQWRVYQLVQELIRFADTKAAAILTADGVLLGVQLSLFSRTYDNPLMKILMVIAGVISVLAYASSVFYCVVCIAPRRAASTPSLIFFEHIGSMSESDYLETLKAETTNDRLTDINNQVWAISRYCRAKYNHVRVGVWATAIGAFFTVGAVIIAIFASGTSG